MSPLVGHKWTMWYQLAAGTCHASIPRHGLCLSLCVGLSHDCIVHLMHLLTMTHPLFPQCDRIRTLLLPFPLAFRVLV